MIENNHLAINDTDQESETEMTKDIPLKDQFFMSDLEKYYKYGKFPYLFIIQLLLVIVTTTVVKRNFKLKNFKL